MIELRQAIEILIGKLALALSPVFAERSEVVIKRAVLLGQENNVVQRLQSADKLGAH